MKHEVYKNEKGQFHRVDGPAYINGNYKAWIMNGLYHRVNGPAIVGGVYYKSWWINNKEIMYSEDYIHEGIKDFIYGI